MPLAEFVLKDLTGCRRQLHADHRSHAADDAEERHRRRRLRLLKIDTLDNRSISERIMRHARRSRSANAGADIVVFSDFRHGIFNRDTIPTLTAAIPADTFRVADSQVASRWGNILEFQGFDLITPNEREARFALGDQDSVVRPLGLELYRRADCKTLILKLGERGMMTYRAEPMSDEDVRSFFAIDSFADRSSTPWAQATRCWPMRRWRCSPPRTA